MQGRGWARIGALAMIMGLGGGSALAAQPAGAPACNDVPALADAGPLTTAVVRSGVARTPFYKGGVNDGAACPAFGAACEERSYLVAGDRVIVSLARGDFVCAHYVQRRQRGPVNYPEPTRSGWLKAADLAAEPPPAPANWIGTWRRAEADLEIASGPKPWEVTVKGEATFGALDPERVKRGAVNMGAVSGVATPADAALSFSAADAPGCKVWMRRVGPWLIVNDNGACGGANVSFGGLYVRTTTTRR